MKESHQLDFNSSLWSVVKELQLFSSLNRNRKRNSSQLLAKKGRFTHQVQKGNSRRVL